MSPAEPPGLLKVENLACLRAERIVFARVEFALGPGEALLVTGPNGSGKSSLLRTLAGLILPLGGRILWRGREMREDAEAVRAEIGFVGHLDAVRGEMDLTENLAFWAALRGTGDGTDDPAGARRRVVQAALAAFGLDHLADLPARFLSQGQRRRLGLARLLVAPAPLWLLDEPTTALDAAAVTALEGVVAAHRAGGGIVIAATHQSFALPGAQRLDMAAHAAGEPAC